MGRSKVIYGGETLIDLTEDTVKAEILGKGFTAHDKSGEQIIGTCSYPIEPLEFDYNIGYVDNGTWTWQYPTNTHTDIYEVQGGHSYVAIASGDPGTRWRVMFTDVDIREMTSGSVRGTKYENLNNPSAHKPAICNDIPSDGYLLVGKDNNYREGVMTYLLDVTDW